MTKKPTKPKIPEEITDNWFKLHDAAQMLSVSEITLRRKIKNGKIKHQIKDGKYFVYLNKNDYHDKKINILPKAELELRKLTKIITDQKILIDALENTLSTYLNKNKAS
jgi:hypothetical protein